ncbi:hypothetical protein A2154_04755 [Candidatus Gottesmanbacteria bacterium RBG_16_43_7]|uniref:Uncharacterized protein n=1 Tax=Candidatus Gottesmanbacteria bacterium RBG_16_43_7 TaxID=1798373 RepID=A0A1F5Z7P2_9BACT|nr:MAG: hypothetical protein A2154_04755 [Candidatus Gottesmanbacteria bacterium RBG_16_43_7]
MPPADITSLTDPKYWRRTADFLKIQIPDSVDPKDHYMYLIWTAQELPLRRRMWAELVPILEHLDELEAPDLRDFIGGALASTVTSDEFFTEELGFIWTPIQALADYLSFVHMRVYDPDFLLIDRNSNIGFIPGDIRYDKVRQRTNTVRSQIMSTATGQNNCTDLQYNKARAIRLQDNFTAATTCPDLRQKLENDTLELIKFMARVVGIHEYDQGELRQAMIPTGDSLSPKSVLSLFTDLQATGTLAEAFDLIRRTIGTDTTITSYFRFLSRLWGMYPPNPLPDDED